MSKIYIQKIHSSHLHSKKIDKNSFCDNLKLTDFTFSTVCLRSQAANWEPRKRNNGSECSVGEAVKWRPFKHDQHDTLLNTLVITMLKHKNISQKYFKRIFAVFQNCVWLNAMQFWPANLNHIYLRSHKTVRKLSSCINSRKNEFVEQEYLKPFNWNFQFQLVLKWTKPICIRWNCKVDIFLVNYHYEPC